MVMVYKTESMTPTAFNSVKTVENFILMLADLLTTIINDQFYKRLKESKQLILGFKLLSMV